MNTRQVITLWGIALTLGAAVAAVKFTQNSTAQTATQRTRGQLLLTTFPAADTTTIELQGLGTQATLSKKDGKWTVTQRDSYPANHTFVNDFIRTLSELKVTLPMEAAPTFAPRFGMDPAATQPADHGITATLKDATGKTLAQVTLGKTIDSTAADPSAPIGNNAVGRYIRNHADSSAFYAVSEMFPSVTALPSRWIQDTFINPEKLQSITLTSPSSSTLTWQLTRDAEDAEFKLEGTTPTETLNTAEVSAFKTLLSYARFEDIVPTSQVPERTASGEKHTATLRTFEGFTYTLTLTPSKPSTTPTTTEDGPTATDNFLLTVAVTAELPKERKPEPNEKPEDTEAKNTAFANRLKLLTDKLTQEKTFAGITFEVSKSTIAPLLKTRADLLAKPATPAPTPQPRP